LMEVQHGKEYRLYPQDLLGVFPATGVTVGSDSCGLQQPCNAKRTTAHSRSGRYHGAAKDCGGPGGGMSNSAQLFNGLMVAAHNVIQ
jgi:hypothetical protein